ncbi:MAG: glycoside hydrolase family 20 zincin-like fold domain-containing protein, partial [Armatimonadota bacterium]
MRQGALLLVLAGVLCAGAEAAEVRDVSPEEAQAWQRWAIPLPKQISISRKLNAAPAQIGIRLRRDATEPEEAAAAQLEELLGGQERLAAADQLVRIVIGVCDDEGMVRGRKAIDPERLRRLPNSDQAYAIVPLGDSELVLTALTPAGVYYAAQTLRQLLEATITGGRVEVPLAEVLDWPDLSERGEWGGSSVRDIEMLAAHKMNLVETHVGLHVREDGTTEVTMSAEDRARARANALNLVPIITHLEHLKRTGLYDVYPELAGEGYDIETAPRGLIAPCASNPRFVDILAGWMDGLASLEGVTDICAWLSESHVQCECEECQKVGQFVLETRALVKAYRQIEGDHPDVGLRILLTQGSYETNDKVLEEVPPDIGVTYYHGGRTYDSSRDEMIYPLLEDYAAEGRWLGCYPQLTASWRIVCPWTGPQFIHYRMNEFVNDGLECLCGYATPDNICYEFNVIAAAEWSWNAGGRSPREFAAAYFTRRGFEDPDAAAEWAVRMGPVGWDLYGSRVPYSAFFGRAAAIVKGRTVPTLGEGMYRYFPTLQRLDEDIETCRWAAETARVWQAPTLVAEAETIGGMLRMLRGIYDMTVVLSRETPEPAQTRQRLNELMYEMALASQQATTGLRNWRDSLEGWDGAARFDDTIEVIDQTASEIGEFMQQ